MASTLTDTLALDGGPRAIPEPLPGGAAARSLIDEREVEAVSAVIRSGQLFRFADHDNSQCTQFEKEACDYVGVKYGLIVNSGTDALICGLVGLGVGPGDEVLVPAYTYIASAAAVVAVGAVPVIVECDESLGMDPADAAAKITPYTKAMLPVHMQGVPCRLADLLGLAKEQGLLVLEDCCQSIGARYHGRVTGSFGDAGAWSLNYYKVITCGEGGFVFTNSYPAYERICFTGEPGLPMWMKDNYGDSFGWQGEPFSFLGLRSNEISAAMIRVQLSKIETALGRTRAVKHAVLDDLDPAPRHYRLQHQDDPRGDCGLSLALICHNQETAHRFGAALSAEGMGTGAAHREGFPDRHIYRYWDSILNKRAYHPHASPWTHPAYKGRVEYHQDMCPRTLDILNRTLRLGLNVNMTAAHGQQIAAAINKVDRLI
ncbi:MAG: aminotransferase class I/II-fold pyridoxal phosphate-dependent enzyme [Fimbriimonadaceae bacterium]|nr:aminotransferase class I/II-fold pyridoxal phosphate-dependent enzyme [Fimbriimonadaceae bacterium]